MLAAPSASRSGRVSSKRVRRLARASAVGYLKMREEKGYPLLKGLEDR